MFEGGLVSVGLVWFGLVWLVWCGVFACGWAPCGCPGWFGSAWFGFGVVRLPLGLFGLRGCVARVVWVGAASGPVGCGSCSVALTS